MAGPTNVGVNDPKAVKKWSAKLFVDMTKKSYFEKKFVSKDENSVLQRLTDLETGAGDEISFDVSVQLRGTPTTGDERVEGKAENLRFFTDKVKIDQTRKTVSAGGRMSRKRTLHNMRTIGRNRLSDYWSRYLDELVFIYLSGSRGSNEDYLEPLTFAGHAENPIQAPDDNHLFYGGSATSKATLTSADKMTREIIEAACVHAEMMQAADPKTANMQPMMIDGEEHFVMVMSPYQSHDLRLEAGQTGWNEIQKAAITADGAKKSPIFKGGLGMINNTVLHQHRSVIRFKDYGAGGDVHASRALFMGRQAGVIAYGAPEEGRNKRRGIWSEEMKDHGNDMEICAGYILGAKKTRFNSRDFGIIAVDTAAKSPK